MKVSMFQVDAFTGTRLAGNRAAVCLLDTWPPDEVLQAVATKNALSETAFLVEDERSYDLRWFTPTTEVDLCGHATLASAHVVLSRLRPGRTAVTFRTRSGELGVVREGEILTLDLPLRRPVRAEVPASLTAALGEAPREAWSTPGDWLALYPTEDVVRRLRPDMATLRTLDRSGVIVTAPGDDADFVSRYFAPALGVPEDPVTGSAHCALTPFWAARLGKDRLRARQISEAGGELFCALAGDRVRIGGRAEPFLEAVIDLEV